MGKCMNAKGYIAVLSEYGKFPASRAKCGTSTFARVPVFKFFQPVRSCASEQEEGVHEAAQRGATRVRDHAHGFLMKVCLIDRGEATCKKKHRATRGKHPLRLFGCITAPMGRVEFSPPMSTWKIL